MRWCRCILAFTMAVALPTLSAKMAAAYEWMSCNGSPIEWDSVSNLHFDIDTGTTTPTQAYDAEAVAVEWTFSPSNLVVLIASSSLLRSNLIERNAQAHRQLAGVAARRTRGVQGVRWRAWPVCL